MLMMQGFDYLPLGWAHHSANFGNMGDGPQLSGRRQPGDGRHRSGDGLLELVLQEPAAQGPHGGLHRQLRATPARATRRASAGKTRRTPASSAVVYTSPVYSDPLTLFDAYFMTATQQTVPLRKTLVDRVLGDYNSLRQSNTRLGAVDRQRLDLHIQFSSRDAAKGDAGRPGLLPDEGRPATSPIGRSFSTPSTA